MAAYLSVQNARKTFGSFVALNDISLDIDEGEFICFLGPSGCGKTTLLRSVAGLEIIDSGRILQAQKDITRLAPSQRDFGILFQSYALFPNLTVFDNIAYGLVAQRQSGEHIARRVAELVRLVGIGGQEMKYPAQLSGGQQQRVALARAIAPEPGLLLLDEPLSALDAKVRAHLRRELRAVHRQIGLTTIMVTHDREEALTLADRIAVMNAGRIEQIGQPDAIYHQPATPFVADFISAMNLFEATVIGPTGIRCGGLDLELPATAPVPRGKVTIGFKPEDARLVDPSAPGRNVISGRIADLDNLGSIIRLYVASPLGKADVRIDLASAALPRLPALDDQVSFEVPPERILRYEVAP